MRTLTNIYEVAGARIDANRESALELQELSQAIGDSAQAAHECASRSAPVSTAVRIVSVMAVGQALLFMAIWLLVCASAGAAPDVKKAGFQPAMTLSLYLEI